MDAAPDIATTLEAWLACFLAPRPALREIGAPADPCVAVPALAALAAEALARDRGLLIATADDAWLPDISNALDLNLRPLCLVLPGAEYAGRIALKATLSLLKSRLARAGADSEGPAWTAMRARLQADDPLWRAAQAWGGRNLDREAPPAGLAELFPVRIMPWSLAQSLAAPPDWVMLVQSERLPQTLRSPWPQARATLILAPGPIGGSTGLATIDTCARLRAEIEVLGQELAEMELELATAQGELAGFAERYHALIAGPMAELDGLRAELARLRMRAAPDDPALDAAARAARARAERSRRENEAYAERKSETETRADGFAPSKDLKKRFRQLAQKIHPDRAQSESDRAWRTQLMSEANRAYRAGDAQALEEILSLWLEGQSGARRAPFGAVAPAPSSAEEDALNAQLARIRARLAAIAAELDRLYGSKLYELFAAARVARRQERDLLREMADQLAGQIELARDELERGAAAARASEAVATA